MKKLKNLLAILLIFLTLKNSIVCAEDVVVIVKDSPAPFTGLLMTQEKANTIYNELTTFKLLNTSLEKSVTLYKQNEELYEKKVNVLLEQNTKLSESLQKERTSNNWEKVLWFGLGFISVAAGIYGVQAITK